MAVLTDAQIQQVKNLLGYGNITALALPYIETALVFETVIQQNVDDYGSTYITGTIFPNVTAVEAQIQAAMTRYQASELVGEIKLNPVEHQKLLELREFWIERLSETVRIRRAPRMNRYASEMDIY